MSYEASSFEETGKEGVGFTLAAVPVLLCLVSPTIFFFLVALGNERDETLRESA